MKLYLAPIQSMTVACYRNAFARYFGNIDAYYAPFIATSEIKKTSTLLKDLLPENNDPSVKLVPQLLGNEGAHFRSFACAISDMGYNEINWNIGCPFPTVTKKKKGSGLLPYPEAIKEFLDIACSESCYSISVKMRLGMTDPEEGLKVIEILNDYPLQGIIMHARCGIQMYDGKADLDAFEKLAISCKHDITYNGDILSCDDFIKISSRLPFVKSFMMGRGALRDPFLPLEIKGSTVSSENKLSLIKKFHDELFEFYQNKLSGDKHLCDKMKEFWDFMHFHLDEDGKFMKKIKKCHSTSEYKLLVNQFFQSVNCKNL